jgi:hypothetical protein
MGVLLTPAEMTQAILDRPDLPMGQAIMRFQVKKLLDEAIKTRAFYPNGDVDVIPMSYLFSRLKDELEAK